MNTRKLTPHQWHQWFHQLNICHRIFPCTVLTWPPTNKSCILQTATSFWDDSLTTKWLTHPAFQPPQSQLNDQTTHLETPIIEKRNVWNYLILSLSIRSIGKVTDILFEMSKDSCDSDGSYESEHTNVWVCARLAQTCRVAAPTPVPPFPTRAAHLRSPHRGKQEAHTSLQAGGETD